MDVEPPSSRASDAARRAGGLALFVTAVAAVSLALSALVALALGVVAFGLALRAYSAAGRARSPRRVAIVALSLSPVVVLLAGSLSLVQAFFGEQLDRYEECMRGANTHTASDQCQLELRREIGRRMGLGGG